MLRMRCREDSTESPFGDPLFELEILARKASGGLARQKDNPSIVHCGADLCRSLDRLSERLDRKDVFAMPGRFNTDGWILIDADEAGDCIDIIVFKDFARRGSHPID